MFCLFLFLEFFVGLRKLWSISSWAPQHQKFENPWSTRRNILVPHVAFSAA